MKSWYKLPLKTCQKFNQQMMTTNPGEFGSYKFSISSLTTVQLILGGCYLSRGKVIILGYVYN